MVSLPSSSTILVYSLSSVPREQVDQIVQSIIQSGTPSTTPPVSPGTTDESHPTATTSARRGPRPWTIRNRYYTCEVQFVHVTLSKDVNSGIEDEDEDGYQVQGDEPAVIVVALHTKTPPTDLTTLLSTLASRDPEFDITLLLTSPPHQESSSQQISPSTSDDQAWDDLALDHRFEYVPLSSSLQTPSTLKKEAKDHQEDDEADSGEKRGLERVVEALHAHMWEHMIPSTRTQAQDEYERSAQDPTPADDLNLLDLPTPALPKAREYKPFQVEWPERLLPNLTRGSTKMDRVERKDEELGFDDDFSDFVSGPLGGKGGETRDEIPSSLSTADDLTVPSRHDNAVADDDLTTFEQQDQELEALFAQLSTAREQAMGMTDMDERRAYAEKTVLSLLG